MNFNQPLYYGGKKIEEIQLAFEKGKVVKIGATANEETLADGSTRTVLQLPAVLAPTKAAILPLVNKMVMVF